MSAYFERLDQTRFRANDGVGGAWDPDEQHIAPALGLIAHEVEREHHARRKAPLQLARISYDILGVMPIDEVEVTVRMLRPGRTIELVEAQLSHDGRPAVSARAWWMQQADTAALAGSGFAPMPPRAELAPWSGAEVWPGEFVTTVEARRRQAEPGRAWTWLRPRVALLGDEPVSATARLLGMIDFVNGVTVRVGPEAAVFPNIDLTAHLFRVPGDDWIGCDTTVSFGPTGMGLTHTILHDERGPLGAVEQSLTVRPR
ncbi:thioesterase family protein [Microbacterium luticocti]|uniref:thioesterase family protein n=1 Tax=Microbacterium luticocti TaxID=451764 RepID=UPI0004070794|nr:thioesterase family protein [Microbacterium luticocti]